MNKGRQKNRSSGIPDKAERKDQYHPPACASLELEFKENEDQMTYKPEHVLNAKPNVADLLIIKEENAVPQSGLGAIFRKYNICEYKSPKDRLDERIYYRTAAYANLLAAYDKEVDSLKEITLTFIRQAKPVRLLKRFREWGFRVTEYETGIYHVKKPGHMDMQIIVTRLLDKKYKWITKLTDQVEFDDIRSMMEEVEKLTDERDLLNAEAVFDLMAKLNRNKEWMKEVTGMGAFRDLFKEDFEQRDRKIAEQSERISEQSERISEQSERISEQSERISEQSEKISELNEQLQSKDEQLKTKDEEVSRLKAELEQLKKQMGKIAIF